MKANRKTVQQKDDPFDLTNVLKMVSGNIGEENSGTSGRKGKQNNSNNDDESITLNDIFNISARLIKDSNITENLTELLKNNAKNNIEKNDPSTDKNDHKQADPFVSGILSMVTGLINEENPKNGNTNVQSDLKKLQKRVDQLNKELSELKQDGANNKEQTME